MIGLDWMGWYIGPFPTILEVYLMSAGEMQVQGAGEGAASIFLSVVFSYEALVLVTT
jgi:hypothetical protein